MKIWFQNYADTNVKDKQKRQRMAEQNAQNQVRLNYIFIHFLNVSTLIHSIYVLKIQKHVNQEV